jgi:hypothetical protein
MKYVSLVFGGEYDVRVENENESYRCVIIERNDGTNDSFITRAFLMFMNEALNEIEKKYEGVYWCVDTRERYTAEGMKYAKCVVEVHAPVRTW